MNKAKKHIELNRSNLLELKKRLPIEKIRIYDFKLSREQINSAELILFTDDDDKIVELKNRYKVWK